MVLKCCVIEPNYNKACYLQLHPLSPAGRQSFVFQVSSFSYIYVKEIKTLACLQAEASLKNTFNKISKFKKLSRLMHDTHFN